MVCRTPIIECVAVQCFPLSSNRTSLQHALLIYNSPIIQRIACKNGLMDKLYVAMTTSYY